MYFFFKLLALSWWQGHFLDSQLHLWKNMSNIMVTVLHVHVIERHDDDVVYARLNHCLQQLENEQERNHWNRHHQDVGLRMHLSRKPQWWYAKPSVLSYRYCLVEHLGPQCRQRYLSAVPTVRRRSPFTVWLVSTMLRLAWQTDSRLVICVLVGCRLLLGNHQDWVFVKFPSTGSRSFGCSWGWTGGIIRFVLGGGWIASRTALPTLFG